METVIANLYSAAQERFIRGAHGNVLEGNALEGNAVEGNVVEYCVVEANVELG